jgi:hypothetical protein
MKKTYLKKDDLKNLIKSLSTAELRYFFQYLKSLNHQSTPYYLKLFDEIANPKSQFTQLPIMTSKKAYTNAKARLYEQLTLCLRSYHQENSSELKIQNLLCDIEILYDRGLPEQSLTLLKKARDEAATFENYGLLLQILTWERKLNIILDSPTRTNFEIAKEEKQIFDNFDKILDLENIYSKVIEIKRTNGYVKGAARAALEEIILENPVLNTAKEISSKRGTYYYHFIHSLYYWLTLDHKKAYSYSKKLLAPELQHISPNEYLEGVLQHVTSCMGLGYFSETLEGLALADTFISQKRFTHSLFFLLRVFYFRICYKLIVYSYMGSLAGLRKTIEEANIQIEHYKQQLSIEMKLVIYGNLRNAYIASGDFDKAEELLNILLYKESKYVRKDVYNDLFLSRVFACFAVKDYALISSMAAAAHRQYKQVTSEEKQFDIGLKITSFLMKDHQYQDPSIKESVILNIKSILEKHITSLKGMNKFHEIYSFYLIWTISLLQEQPFHATAAAWYRQHLASLNKDAIMETE